MMNDIHRSVEKHLNIILFLLIAMPGLRIKGEIINFVDIYLFVLYLKYILNRRKNISLILTSSFVIIEKQLISLYIFIALFSIFINFIMNSNINYFDFILMVMKWSRLFELYIVYSLFSHFSRYINQEQMNRTVLLSGIFSAVLSIFFFVSQNSYYLAHQTLKYHGVTTFRGVGIYGESTALGIMMGIVFIIAFIQYKKSTLLSIVAIILASISMSLAYSRGPIVALFVCFAVYIYNSLRYSTSISIKDLVVIFCILFFLYKIEIVNQFLHQRILPLFDVFLKGHLINKKTFFSDKIDTLINNINSFFNQKAVTPQDKVTFTSNGINSTIQNHPLVTPDKINPVSLNINSTLPQNSSATSAVIDRAPKSLSTFIENKNSLSSGRLDIWFDRIRFFLQDRRLYPKIIGYGYKSEKILFCDNLYLNSLLMMGLSGFTSLILYIIYLLKNHFLDNSYKNPSYYLVIFFIILMFTCDVITITRPVAVIFLYFAINLSNKSNESLA